MTKELEHISQYLIEFVDNNYDKLTDDFKTTGNYYQKILTKQELIEVLKTDEELVGWALLEGLSWACDKDYCQDLIVFSNDDYYVFNINNKYIKYNYKTFQFVEKKTKTITIDVWE